MWWARSTINAVQIALHLLERQREQQRFARSFFDIGCLPIPPASLKAAAGLRDPAQIDLIVVHVTAVNGGFGLAASARKRWRARLDHPFLVDVPEELVAQLVECGDVEQLDAFYGVVDPDLLARRLGTWERYRSTPYHQIASQAGDSIANRALSQRSFHAGLGNDGVGLAIDAGPQEPLSSDLIETGRLSLHNLANRLLDAGAPGPFRVQPHRCFDSNRVRDTDLYVWREIVLPVVHKRADMFVDYELQLGTGRPVPREWDPSAVYDLRGRRV